eukprot:scaffold6362_cov378-Prasinococcus_capsulatus_cf.AAC.15
MAASGCLPWPFPPTFGPGAASGGPHDLNCARTCNTETCLLNFSSSSEVNAARACSCLAAEAALSSCCSAASA